jgi:hypothetical protein
MSIITLIPHYAAWHYSAAFKNIHRIWRNYLWFFYHFFAIPHLFSTLFSPWRRLHEEYKGGFDPGGLLSAIIINVLMRAVGAFIRILFIVVGLGIMGLTFVLGIIFFIAWVVLPVILAGLLVAGLALLVS